MIKKEANNAGLIQLNPGHKNIMENNYSIFVEHTDFRLVGIFLSY